MSGCGATTVSRLVGEKLKIKNINCTFKNLAADKKLDFNYVQSNALKKGFDFELDSKIIKMARGDFVLASRLACWLSDYNLSVWLEAGVETRSRRIAEREKASFEKVLNETIKRDEQNIERYKKLYGINILDHSFVDVIINVETFSASQAAEFISTTAKNMRLRKNKFSSMIKNRIRKNLLNRESQ